MQVTTKGTVKKEVDRHTGKHAATHRGLTATRSLQRNGKVCPRGSRGMQPANTLFQPLAPTARLCPPELRKDTLPQESHSAA